LGSFNVKLYLISQEKIEEMVRDFCSVVPKSKSEVRQRIHQAIAEERERVLVDYTEFLLKYGYVDSDVYAEEPEAVERYLSSLDKTNK